MGRLNRDAALLRPCSGADQPDLPDMSAHTQESGKRGGDRQDLFLEVLAGRSRFRCWRSRNIDSRCRSVGLSRRAALQHCTRSVRAANCARISSRRLRISLSVAFFMTQLHSQRHQPVLLGRAQLALGMQIFERLGHVAPG